MSQWQTLHLETIRCKHLYIIVYIYIPFRYDVSIHMKLPEFLSVFQCWRGTHTGHLIELHRIYIILTLWMEIITWVMLWYCVSSAVGSVAGEQPDPIHPTLMGGF